ncbi:MAG: hypothetical protein RR350_05590 [Oscillibacter sp.]
MRSKAPLVLMEQLFMVLVFALAAALCLRVFVLSEQMSRQNELRDQAVTTCQTMAETLKHCGGDYAAAAALAGGEWDGQTWGLSPAADGEYIALATPADTGSALLGGAEITALTADGDWLFGLTAAWQEGEAHG